MRRGRQLLFLFNRQCHRVLLLYRVQGGGLHSEQRWCCAVWDRGKPRLQIAEWRVRLSGIPGNLWSGSMSGQQLLIADLPDCVRASIGLIPGSSSRWRFTAFVRFEAETGQCVERCRFVRPRFREGLFMKLLKGALRCAKVFCAMTCFFRPPSAWPDDPSRDAVADVMRGRRERIRSIAFDVVAEVRPGGDHDRYFFEAVVEYDRLVSEFYGTAPSPRGLSRDAIARPPRYFEAVISEGLTGLAEWSAPPRTAGATLWYHDCFRDGRWERFYPERQAVYFTKNAPGVELLSALGVEMPPLKTRLPHREISACIRDEGGAFMKVSADSVTDSRGNPIVAVTMVAEDRAKHPEYSLAKRVVLRLDPQLGMAPVECEEDTGVWLNGEFRAVPGFAGTRIVWTGHREYEPGLWLASSVSLDEFDMIVFPQSGRFQRRLAGESDGGRLNLNPWEIEGCEFREYHVTHTTMITSNLRFNQGSQNLHCQKEFSAGTGVMDRDTGQVWRVIRQGNIVPGNLRTGEEPDQDPDELWSRFMSARFRMVLALANLVVLTAMAILWFRTAGTRTTDLRP